MEFLLFKLKVGQKFRFLGTDVDLIVTGFCVDKVHGERLDYLQYYDSRILKL